MTLQRTLLYIGVAAVVGAGLVHVGRSHGEKVAMQSVERLRVVWPYVLEMPEGDRAVLAGLALSCRLHTKEAVPGVVIACLREAAVDPNALRPKQVSMVEAKERLERLIALSDVERL